MKLKVLIALFLWHPPPPKKKGMWLKFKALTKKNVQNVLYHMANKNTDTKIFKYELPK